MRGVQPLSGWPLLVATGLLAACAGPGNAPGGASPTTLVPSKSIVIGIVEEPPGFGPFNTHTSGGGAQQIEEIVQRYLATLDSQTHPQPDVATELPSLENGSWEIRPDGTMQTTFRLRTNVRWHDGSAMTADDWVFGWEVDHDPTMPNFATVPVRYISGARAANEHTLILEWSQTFPFANGLTRGQLNPLQRARFEGLYQTDHDRLINSPAWSTEFIGLGPFRIAEWTAGAQLKLAAVDAFYLGKPRVDTLIVRFLRDPNTLLANILSDAIDVYLPLGLQQEAVVDLQRSWAAPDTGNRVLVYPDGRLRFVEVQWRPDLQKPKALADQRVREAMYRSIDRQPLADAIIPTGSQAADSWLLPNDPLRGTVFKGAVPDYSFNRAASQRLLEQAGFRRGADGVLANPATSERFETLVWNTNGGGNEKENSIVADSLRSIGIAAEQYIIPASLLDDSAARASFPGVNITARTVTADFENAQLRYREPTRTTPLGAPRGGYNNPEVNALVDRLQVTIPDDERAQIAREVMERVLQDLQLLPLYWNVETLTTRKGVTGVEGRSGRYNQYPLATWNVYAWDVVRS